MGLESIYLSQTLIDNIYIYYAHTHACIIYPGFSNIANNPIYFTSKTFSAYIPYSLPYWQEYGLIKEIWCIIDNLYCYIIYARMRVILNIIVKICINNLIISIYLLTDAK